MVFKRPKKGDKKGWGSKDKAKSSHGSGWIYDGTHWVHYKGNKPTGNKEKHGFTTTAVRGLGVGSLVKKIRGKDNKNNTSSNKSTLTKNTKSKLTFKNMKEAGMLDKKSKSTTASKKSADSEKADWLKKTRNSPAAKSGAFTDEQRWAQHVKHRDSQAARKAKTEAKKNKLKATQGKSMPSNPKGMRQEGVGKTAKDLTRHTTGSSETKKKKKKKLTKNEIKYPTRGTFRGI